MSRLRSSLLTAAAVTGAVLAPAAPALGAPIPLALESAVTPVAAYEGVVMWSHFDPAEKTYSLVQSIDGGAPTPVAVAARTKGPFDVDLGTNRSGSTYAVYTRDDGDIYRLRVASGSEVKVAKLSSPAIAERDPTIMRGEIAFIRRDHGYDQLRIGNTSSHSKGSRLIVKRRSIVGAELATAHVAYIVTAPGPISDTGTKYVHIRNLRTRADRRVYRAVSGGANYANVTRPTYVAAPRGFMWVRTNQGSGRGNRFVRYTLRGSKLAYALGSSRLTVSSAWAGSRLGAATSTALADTACDDAGVHYCDVGLSGRLRFDAKP